MFATIHFRFEKPSTTDEQTPAIFATVHMLVGKNCWRHQLSNTEKQFLPKEVRDINNKIYIFPSIQSSSVPDTEVFVPPGSESGSFHHKKIKNKLWLICDFLKSDVNIPLKSNKQENN
jgi:hypothetical protein